MDENRRIKAHIRKLVYGPVLILPVIAVFLIVALVINEEAAKFLVILLGVALVFCIAWVLLMQKKSYSALIEYSEAISGDVGVPWFYADFKKRDGFRRSVALCQELGIYRQDYCGCRLGAEPEGEGTESC